MTFERTLESAGIPAGTHEASVNLMRSAYVAALLWASNQFRCSQSTCERMATTLGAYDLDGAATQKAFANLLAGCAKTCGDEALRIQNERPT